jgi:[CysO sulfur-carrier protein]-S-L-cysteine hydrolase
MNFPRALYDEMVEHALQDDPNECCGMVSSRDGVAVGVHRARNIFASPLRYEIDSDDLFRIQMAMMDEDLDLGAIYHSHTRSDPYPSQTDINAATYPDSLYIIIGTKSSEPVVRAFKIIEGKVEETDLVVV